MKKNNGGWKCQKSDAIWSFDFYVSTLCTNTKKWQLIGIYLLFSSFLMFESVVGGRNAQKIRVKGFIFILCPVMQIFGI